MVTDCNDANKLHSVDGVVKLTFRHYYVLLQIVCLALRAESGKAPRYPNMTFQKRLAGKESPEFEAVIDTRLQDFQLLVIGYGHA